MSEFIVSARKYRPETFKSVVGQQGIANTLKNAILNNHLGHAYLFCGPRGVGKTTCARIFAKSINCNNLTPEGEPCNECESCNAFNDSRSYNIRELDAASNNKVEDIRTLTEQVRIPPQIGKYSVYIIDEVHMLSLSAFNAFLKTLEEPPAHAIFILATTEKHKIIPTILSRCQIFDFNRIRVEDTVNFLKYIAEKESVNAEEEALHIIAQKADGAMRDALSIFDQVVSFSGNEIRYSDVVENLNILDFDYYFKLTDYFLQEDLSGPLILFDEILKKGFDGHNFLSGLASHFRELLVSKDKETIKLLEVSEGIKNRYLGQTRQCSTDFLLNALDICGKTDIHYQSSRNQRLHIELCLLQLSGLTAEKKNAELKKDSPKNASPEGANGGEKSGEKEPERNLSAGDKREPDHLASPVRKQENPVSPRKNVVSGTGISIKLAMSGQQEEDNEGNMEESSGRNSDTEPEKELRQNAFSSEDLIKYWHQFAERLKDDKPRLFTSMDSREPELGDNYTIKVGFDNSSQEEEFNHSLKNPVLNFLKRKLENDKIEITVYVSESKNEGRRLYTVEDRFNYLTTKYPLLGKLKQEFNLDFN